MTAKTDDKAKAPAKAKEEAEPKAGKMKHYVSTEDVALKGGVVKAGTPFVSDAEPGDSWEELSPKEAAAQETATATIPADEVFDAASDTALEAWCLMKGIDIRNLKSRDDYLAAAKAYNEPTL